ncbi:MAG: hypothetical protein VXZ82_01215 [Planctomycetota bacterium]|nr:hypothetical protein [Planctomycetota bacterium]
MTFLSATQVCNRLGVSSRTLKKAVESKQFPPAVVFGGKRVWLDKTIEMVLAEIQKAQSCGSCSAGVSSLQDQDLAEGE